MYKNIREIFVFVVEVLDYLCHNTKAHGYSRAFRFQVWQEKLSRFQRHQEKRIAFIHCIYLLFSVSICNVFSSYFGCKDTNKFRANQILFSQSITAAALPP